MVDHFITSVISFCSNDYRFIHKLIENARLFSKQMIIAVCDHFFNGEEENFLFLEQIFRKYPDCLFTELQFSLNEPYAKMSPLQPEDPDGVRHWHNCSRLIPFYFVDKKADYIIFFDGDEIPDGEKFLKWLGGFDYRPFSALRFASYWYFREAKYQAETHADTALMVKKDLVNPEWIVNPDERMGFFHRIPGDKKLQVFGLDEFPLVHHYSWVRTKSEMLKKTRCWGHHWERNWSLLIEQEFAREFSGKDFIRGYDYAIVNPCFDPLLENSEPPENFLSLEEHRSNVKQLDNVKIITAHDYFRLDILNRLGLSCPKNT